MTSLAYRILDRLIGIRRLIEWAERRNPNFIVWQDPDARAPYLKRWWVIPRNPLFNIYLHHITASDDDRALHDHPWPNVTIVLRGGYQEVVPMRQRQLPAWDHAGATRTHARTEGQCITRLRPSMRHRLVVAPGSVGAWTLFITGPVMHRWGFYCRHGFVHWRVFTSARDKGAVGRGCA